MPAFGELQLLHDLLGLCLAVAGKGFDERGDLHAADDRVVFHVDHLCKRELAGLEIIADLRALDASSLCLFKGRLTIFRAEVGNSHQ